MPPKAKKKEDEPITLPKLNIKTMRVKIKGESPLIVHAWSEKAKKEMLAKQQKKAKQAKEAKDPWCDFVDSMYWLTPKPENPTQEDVDSATFGFPVVGFKAAAVDACSHIDGVTKVLARGAFHINGEMAVIIGPPPVMREDMVRIAMGTSDIRYRGEFRDWSVELEIRYNANVLSPEQIANLFNTAGFACGVGEWRPQRDGSMGLFSVVVDS